MVNVVHDQFGYLVHDQHEFSRLNSGCFSKEREPMDNHLLNTIIAVSGSSLLLLIYLRTSAARKKSRIDLRKMTTIRGYTSMRTTHRRRTAAAGNKESQAKLIKESIELHYSTQERNSSITPELHAAIIDALCSYWVSQGIPPETAATASRRAPQKISEHRGKETWVLNLIELLNKPDNA